MDGVIVTDLADMEPGRDYLLRGFQEGLGVMLARYDGVEGDDLLFTNKLAWLAGDNRNLIARFRAAWLFEDVRLGVAKITLVPDLD